MMAIYFGVLKKETVYEKIKNEIAHAGIKVLKYYPKLHVLKFRADKIPENPEILKHFDSIEEEKTDFSI